MNNFEQNANFYEDLAQIAHKLELIAENRLPISPIERDMTLQLLRDAYMTVLQCADTHTSTSQPEPVRTAEPVPMPVPVKVAEPEPVKVVEPEPVKAVEPEPVKAVEPEPVKVVEPEPVKAVEPEPVKVVEPEPVKVVEPEPVKVVEPEPVKVVEPEPVKVVEPEPEPIPDILTYLEVPKPAEAPKTEPTVKPEPAAEAQPTPAPQPTAKEEPEPVSGELFPKEPVVAPQPKRSLNDLLGQEDNSLASKFQHSHIDDLSKAISLNDKFLFIKELFKGKGEDFSKAIQKLNTCENIDDAFLSIDMMKKYYSWDTTSSAYLALCDLVRRKFV